MRVFAGKCVEELGVRSKTTRCTFSLEVAIGEYSIDVIVHIANVRINVDRQRSSLDLISRLRTRGNLAFNWHEFVPNIFPVYVQ